VAEGLETTLNPQVLDCPHPTHRFDGGKVFRKHASLRHDVDLDDAPLLYLPHIYTPQPYSTSTTLLTSTGPPVLYYL
jgi:hypothetical protein